ncbi:MAG: hypothetical protein NTZ39_09100 [Methanoregula sp.]|nr:hypothetical protein [Methanoregula sp.]
MTARISDVVRGWLGWCPNRMMAPRYKTPRADNPVSSIIPGDRGYTMQDVIMDYGSTGMSIPLFTIILVGTITGLFGIMRYGLFEHWSSLGILMLGIFILGVAVRMVHQDIKKATVEFTPDTITVRQPLFWQVIIAKDAITTIEVRKNVHHSHRWLFRGAMVIFFFGVIPSILFSGHSLFISRIISRVSFTVFVVYYLAVIVFFGLLFYHGYIRSRYSHVLAICTNTKKIVGLYVDDSGKMYDMVSAWRMGAA